METLNFVLSIAASLLVLGGGSAFAYKKISKKKSSMKNVNQSASGTGNIQITGSDNKVVNGGKK